MATIKKRSVLILAVVLAGSCAIPNASSIRSALDEGELDEALDLARADDRSLDLLAREILVRAALSKETREDALAAIGRVGPRAKPLLKDLAGAKNRLLAITARSMLYRRGERVHEEELIDALDSQYGLIRAQAVLALLPNDQSRNFHEKYILDNGPTARMAVVRFLAGHDLPWSQLLLVDAARRDPVLEVRSAAVRGLDPEDEQARDLLRESLEDKEKSIRTAAASALGKDATSVELTWAAHLLTLPATDEGMAFASSLLRTDPEQEGALDYLAGAIADDSPQVRLKAATALVSLKLEVDGVDELASDPNPQVRMAWCRLTRKLGTSKRKERLEILKEMVDSEDEHPPLGAWVTIAEEKDGYETIRPKVWHLLAGGSEQEQRYVLVHAIRPFADPSLSIRGMGMEDVLLRVTASAAWLSR